MASVDPQEERQRLTGFYGALGDEELLQLGGDLESLTDTAREVILEELGRRGLRPQSADAGFDDFETRNLVVVGKFRDLPAALLAKGALDSAGIECFMGDENIVRMDWFISNLVGGIKLLVNIEDATSAAQVLEEPIPNSFEVEGAGEYQQPSCPRCQSRNIEFEELNKPFAYTSAWVGIPVPMKRKRWVCHSCGHIWRPTELN